MMKIVLIGSGNVAWNLGTLFTMHKHEVVQILSRNATTASALAYAINTESANYYSILNKEADLYVIAVKDDAIEDVVTELIGLNKLVVHTSGAIDIEVLKRCSNRYGSLYPIQSMVYGVSTLPEISFLVQGNTASVEHELYRFVQSLQSSVQPINNADKLKIHIAAVFVNNFTNHLYTLAYEWCKKNRLDFNLLKPLIEESVHRLFASASSTSDAATQHINPATLQTGPAVRKDVETLEKHRAVLKDEPKLLAFYELFTKSIMEVSN